MREAAAKLQGVDETNKMVTEQEAHTQERAVDYKTADQKMRATAVGGNVDVGGAGMAAVSDEELAKARGGCAHTLPRPIGLNACLFAVLVTVDAALLLSMLLRHLNAHHLCALVRTAESLSSRSLAHACQRCCRTMPGAPGAEYGANVREGYADEGGYRGDGRMGDGQKYDERAGYDSTAAPAHGAGTGTEHGTEHGAEKKGFMSKIKDKVNRL